MIANSRRKWDVMPKISLVQGENGEVVEKLKIVRYIFRSDMKTSSNTDYKKARKQESICSDVGHKEAESITCRAGFARSLTKKTDLNRVLRCALHIIYGDECISFGKTGEGEEGGTEEVGKHSTHCS